MQSDRSASSGKNLAKIVKKDLKSNEKITDLSFINNQEIIPFKKSPRKLPVNVQIALPNKIDLTKDLINEHEKQQKQTYGNSNKLKPLINQEKHYDLTATINHHLNNETKITKEIPTHKYPFLHEDHVSIDQLKNKVYKSTLGVLPLRKSSQIEELNFIMRGQPLNKYKNEPDIYEKTNRSNGDDDDDEYNDNDEEEEDESQYEEEDEDDDRIDSEIGFYDKIHANLNTPVTSGMGDPLRSNTNRTLSPVQLNNNYRTNFDFRLREMSNLNPKFKPAILPITGTAGQAKFCQRPKPPKKNTTLTMQTRKKMQQKEREQNASNLLTDETRKETTSVADQQQFDLENQMKELVNEAKGIAGTTPKQQAQHSSSKKLKTDKQNVTRDDQLVSSTKVNERLLLSTVEGLISAIKSGQIIKEQEESNKHIHNILSTILDKESIIQFESVFDREKTVSTLTKESAKSKQDEASSLNVASDLDKMTNVGVLSNNNIQKEAFQSAVNLTSAGSKSLRNESSSLFFEESSKNTQRSIISYDEEINAYLASLPSEVTHTDVLNAYSKRVKLFEKEATVSVLRKEVQPVQQLTTEEKYAKNMHLFCMLEHEQRHSLLLPDELINITRKYHTKNKFESNMFYSGKSALSREPSMSSLKKSSSKQRVDTASMEEAAKRVLNNFPSTVNFDTSATPRSMNDSGFIDNSLESWRLQAETSLNKDFCLEAQKIELNNIELVTDPSLRYLRPAPPKMSIKPSEIRKNLYHDYVSMPPPVLDKVKSATSKSISSKKKKKSKDKLKQEPQHLIDDTLTDEDTDTGSESYSTDSDSESIIQLDKILKRTYNSETNLSKKFNTTTKNTSYFDGFKIKIKRTLSDTIVYDSIKREKNNSDYLDEYIQIDTSYTDALDEAMNQKLKIKENYLSKKRLEELEKKSQLESKKETKSVVTENNEDFFPKAAYRDLVKEASDANRNYIIKDTEDTKKSKKSSRKQFKKLDSNLLNKIQNDMETKNKQNLKRSESLGRIKFPFVIRHPDDLIIRHPRTFLQKKRPSVPNLFDFEEYKNENQFDSDLGDREWTRKIWNIWFDEVIPQLDGTGGRPPSTLDNKKQQQQRREMNISMMSQTNASISVTTRQQQQQTVQTPDDDEEETGEANKDRKKETAKSPTPYDSYSTVQLYEDNVEQKESDLKDIKLFENEIDKLTKRIEIKETAFDLTRRGTLYRKLGHLSLALDDLTKALNLEPNFVDAFWQRHLIYLTQDKKNEAIQDLNILLKINRTHAGAYLSIADLYAEKKELYEALTNYTSAIKYDPNNYMAYFKRAKIYEIRGETRMSMDDYLTTTRLNPKFYDAWFCHGMNYYNNNNWHYAIVDFTELIANCPKNQSKARLYRGKCNLNLGEYQEALNDFGIAIHLNPMDWESYYHRGCLLRKINVNQALQDLSVSLLIENGYDNINAFLHRGIIYSETERFDEAIKDFESALDLDKEFAPAYCNLGIIYMNVHMNYWKAIKNFNNAIKSNHVYLRAYLCRAQAYRCIHDLKRAYIDYTKAIHLDPMNTQVYIYRGQVIYEMGNAKLASFCVQHAAFMNEGMNDNKPQQQTKSDTSATNRSKSAKTGGGQSKKKDEESATTANQSVTQQAVVFSFLKNFSKAISVLEHELKVKPNPEIYNLLGRVFMKAKKLNNAVNSFDESIECIMELIGVKDLKKSIQSYAKLNMPKEMHHYLTEALSLKGQCFLDLANHQEAYNSFDKVIEMEPHNANAFFNRGMARFHLNHPKCIQDFNKALQIKPTLFEAFLARACVYGLKDRVTKAILNCNEAVKICPKSVRAYLYRGALKYLARSYSHAIYDLTKAIELDTTCAVAYFNRALCFQKLKKYNDSLKDYSIVLLLGEYLKYKVYINRGLLYFEIANYANSLKDFLLAADFDRSNFRIQHMIGICLHKLGRYDESIEKLTGAYDTNSKFYDAIISRGNTHIDYGTKEAFHKAQRDYELVLLKDPKNIDAHINLAYLFQMTGKYMKAWSQFSEALNINPNFVQIYEGRSIVCLQMSDTTAALKDINHAIKLKRSAEFYVNRGVIYQFMADNINAMRDYQAAILIDSNYGLAYYNSANILLIHRQYGQAVHMLNIAIDKCNMKDESTYQNRAISKAFIKDSSGAFKDLCEALKYDQYAAHIYMNRGLLLYKMENFKLAEKDLTTAISLSPNDALFYKIRADCLGKLEKKEEAIDDYKQFVDLNDRKELSNIFRQNRITK